MMKFGMAAVAAAGVLCASNAAAAVVDLTPYVNANVRNYSSGGDYPVGNTTIGGINFNIAAFQGGAGIIQLDGQRTSNIAVNQTGVDTVYVILNSAFGDLGRTSGSLTFNGSVAPGVTTSLVQGFNIRDHFQGSGNNVATGVFATAIYDGGNRFDVYRYDISSLGGTLSNINFARNGTENANGLPFIAAITATREAVAAVPEPATWAMMLVGFGMVGASARYRRRSTKTVYA